jgi:acetyl esterase/lipase
VVAFSPWADLTCSGASFDDDHADRDLECTRASLLEMAGWYAPDEDRRDPLISPVFADPTHVPSVLAFVGSEEVLLDDAARIVRAVGGAGGDATLVVGAGLQHVYPIWCGVFPEAREALEITGAWLRARSAAAPPDPGGGRPR